MSIREIYEEAVRKGIKKICVTNHHEPSEVSQKNFDYSLTEEKIRQCISEVNELKKDGKCEIFFGIEMSYIEEEEGYIRDFLKKHKFDLVLGSVHYVQGWALGNWSNKEKMKDLDHEELREEYFENLKKAIKTRMFDVMTHLDLYKRVLNEPEFGKLKQYWEEIAELLIQNNVGFEINTSHSKKVPGGTYPDREIIKLMVRKGVKTITIGSDAHRLEDIGRGLADAEALLKTLGVKNVYFFDKRQPKPIIL
jgi:histidinol-phosphatase (PHP family)